MLSLHFSKSGDHERAYRYARPCGGARRSVLRRGRGGDSLRAGRGGRPASRRGQRRPSSDSCTWRWATPANMPDFSSQPSTPTVTHRVAGRRRRGRALPRSISVARGCASVPVRIRWRCALPHAARTLVSDRHGSRGDAGDVLDCSLTLRSCTLADSPMASRRGRSDRPQLELADRCAASEQRWRGYHAVFLAEVIEGADGMADSGPQRASRSTRSSATSRVRRQWRAISAAWRTSTAIGRHRLDRYRRRSSPIADGPTSSTPRLTEANIGEVLVNQGRSTRPNPSSAMRSVCSGRRTTPAVPFVEMHLGRLLTPEASSTRPSACCAAGSISGWRLGVPPPRTRPRSIWPTVWCVQAVPGEALDVLAEVSGAAGGHDGSTRRRRPSPCRALLDLGGIDEARERILRRARSRRAAAPQTFDLARLLLLVVRIGPRSTGASRRRSRPKRRSTSSTGSVWSETQPPDPRSRSSEPSEGSPLPTRTSVRTNPPSAFSPGPSDNAPRALPSPLPARCHPGTSAVNTEPAWPVSTERLAAHRIAVGSRVPPRRVDQRRLACGAHPGAGAQLMVILPDVAWSLPSSTHVNPLFQNTRSLSSGVAGSLVWISTVTPTSLQADIRVLLGGIVGAADVDGLRGDLACFAIGGDLLATVDREVELVGERDQLQNARPLEGKTSRSDRFESEPMVSDGVGVAGVTEMVWPPRATSMGFETSPSAGSTTRSPLLLNRLPIASSAEAMRTVGAAGSGFRTRSRFDPQLFVRGDDAARIAAVDAAVDADAVVGELHRVVAARRRPSTIGVRTSRSPPASSPKPICAQGCCRDDRLRDVRPVREPGVVVVQREQAVTIANLDRQCAVGPWRSGRSLRGIRQLPMPMSTRGRRHPRSPGRPPSRCREFVELMLPCCTPQSAQLNTQILRSE